MRMGLFALVLGPLLTASTLAATSEIDSARGAYRAGDFHRAIEQYERAGAARRTVAETTELARSYQMTQEPDQAEDLARSVLARAPKNTEALLVLGDVFAMRGNWRQAAVQYAAATASDSPRPEIWLRLGQALQYDGQPAMAELAFDTYRRFHVK